MSVGSRPGRRGATTCSGRYSKKGTFPMASQSDPVQFDVSGRQLHTPLRFAVEDIDLGDGVVIKAGEVIVLGSSACSTHG
jgi:hypothetical protein